MVVCRHSSENMASVSCPKLQSAQHWCWVDWLLVHDHTSPPLYVPLRLHLPPVEATEAPLETCVSTRSVSCVCQTLNLSATKSPSRDHPVINSVAQLPCCHGDIPSSASSSSNFLSSSCTLLRAQCDLLRWSSEDPDVRFVRWSN